MVEHRLLSGDSLHEPKGIEDATSGQVYVSDGIGSGSWVNKFDGNLTLNQFSMNGTIPDISTTSSSFYAIVPYKSTLTKIGVVINTAITTANSVLTIYKNGVAQVPTVTVPFAASAPGTKVTASVSPAISFNIDDVIEVRSNGGSDTTSVGTVTLNFTAVV